MMPNDEILLDQCIEEIRGGGDPEGILKQHPEMAGKIRPLLALASELESLPTPSPSDDSAMKMVAKLALRDADTKAPSKEKRTPWLSLPVLGRAAAIFLCVFLLGWGTSAASSSALPGDLLYPLKRLTERGKFFLTINKEDRAELRIVFSEERLKEAVKKHERGDGIDKELLRAMLDEAKMALETGQGLPEIDRRFLISRSAQLSELQESSLHHMNDNANAEERQELMPFMEMCAQRCGWMRQMMGSDGKKRGIPDAPQQMMRRWMRMCPMWGQQDDGDNDAK